MSRIAYVTSESLRKECDRIPVIIKRASMVHSLIAAYELDDLMDPIEPKTATQDDLALFHSAYYLNYLRDRCNNTGNQSDSDDSEDVDDEQLEYGLGYDCPKLGNLFQFATVIAGGTLTCADLLISGRKNVINWCGGWHHAQRDEAEGFCYVNDIAIGIQRLRSKFQRVFYIDLDIHHGNGVENAFSYTKRVFTLSFHQHSPGFFPGSGAATDCGFGPGRGYSANFPYKFNLDGVAFLKYFLLISRDIKTKYDPDVCIVQCGADAITGDPLGGSNLIPQDLGQCIKEIQSWSLPTMFLGGGGYNLANASRYWTYLTSVICGARTEELDDNIPDHEYFLKYGPGYELSINKRNVKDFNTDVDLEKNYKIIIENLEKYNVHNC